MSIVKDIFSFWLINWYKIKFILYFIDIVKVVCYYYILENLGFCCEFKMVFCDIIFKMMCIIIYLYKIENFW